MKMELLNKSIQPIRVAMISPYYFGSGGSSKHIRKIAEFLSYRQDIELHLLTISERNDKFEGMNFCVHHVMKSMYPITIPFLIRWFLNKIREINPAVIHAEGTMPPCSTAAALLCHQYPTLLTVMGFSQKSINYQSGKAYLNSLINIINERYVIRRIPNIVVQSEYVGKLIRKMTSSQVFFVPEGIDFYKNQDLVCPKSLPEIDVFLAVALIRIKGIDILLKALPEVVTHVPSLKIYLAGSGDEELYCRSLIKSLRLDNNVKLLGYLADEREVSYYYKACKFTVVPSRWDVDPFAPLDAATFGKPAIVSDTCNSAVVEDGVTGFVFKSGDIQNLSKKMIILLRNHELREKMGRTALARAETYDWSRIVDQKVNIYRMLIGQIDQRHKSWVVAQI